MIGWRFHQNRNVEFLQCGNDLIQWIAKVDSHFKSFAFAVEKCQITRAIKENGDGIVELFWRDLK